MSSPVIVNIGQTGSNITNKIIASKRLPVSALYDASGLSNGNILNSLFEFWVSSESLSNIQGTLSGKKMTCNKLSSEGRKYSKMVAKLTLDLQSILESPFDCSEAYPFNDSKYSHTQDYNTQNNFGRLSLSLYAHNLFGHVAATAAITNDSILINSILSKNKPYIFSYNASYGYNISNIKLETVLDAVSSLNDSNLAMLLIKKIIRLDNSQISSIVQSVIDQDPSRGKDINNNILSSTKRHPLKFIAGDKIHININLKPPGVNINNGQRYSNFNSNSNDIQYTIEITLDDSIGTDWGIELRKSKGFSCIETNKSVITDSNKNIYISGYYVSSLPLTFKDISNNVLKDSTITLPIVDTYSLFIVKYNVEGKCQWTNYIKGINSIDEYSLNIDNNENIYITGYYNSSEIILMDVSGNTQKASFVTLPPTITYSTFIIKYNLNGICQWANYINNVENMYSIVLGRSLTTDVSGSINVLGFYNSSSDIILMDISGNTQKQSLVKLSNTTSGALFLVKYNTNGICQWATYVDLLYINNEYLIDKNNLINNYFFIKSDLDNNIYITFPYIMKSFGLIKDASGNTQKNSSVKLPIVGCNTVLMIKYNSEGICQFTSHIDLSSSVITNLMSKDINNNRYIIGYNMLHKLYNL
jgi:hypothetical protein